jgi:thiosulfate/3-mercaptopyruvate sulfurtransferase
MRSLFANLVLAAVVILAAPAMVAPALAAEPLVDVEWAKANIDKPGVVFVDVRSGGGVTKEAYQAEHMPGAIFTDYAKDGWREKINGVEGMLPPPDKVAKLIGSLGIDNDTHVVLVPLGRAAIDMGAATRIYWTFKVMGHDNVSILDGGYQAWTKDIDPKTNKPVNPLASGGVELPPTTFVAHFRKEMIIDRNDVKKAMEAGVTLIDNRPNDFYLGLSVSPAAKRAGTIPGAKNLQESWLTKNNGGSFRSKAQLASLYKQAGVPVEGEQIAFCNTGHWASLGWFVSSEILGNKNVKMYDGSMAEWSQYPELPVEQKFKLD